MVIFKKMKLLNKKPFIKNGSTQKEWEMFCCKQSKAVISTVATDMTLLVVNKFVRTKMRPKGGTKIFKFLFKFVQFCLNCFKISLKFFVLSKLHF